MEIVTVPTLVCPHCRSEAPPSAGRCPRCGRVLRGGEPRDATRQDVGRSLRENVVDNPWAVLGVLFFAAGALGLPVLWNSRAFSRTAKILLSIAVSAYSAAILAVMAYVFLLAVRVVLTLSA